MHLTTNITIHYQITGRTKQLKQLSIYTTSKVVPFYKTKLNQLEEKC